MAVQQDFIFIPSLSGKRGTPVFRKDYIRMKAYLLGILLSGTDFILTDLLQTAREGLVQEVSGDIGWLMLLVKADLEREGMLKQSRPSPGRRFPRLRVASVRKARKEYDRLQPMTTGIESPG